jgi:putative tryptophan/tyrosine transport system substrate-binding protein
MMSELGEVERATEGRGLSVRPLNVAKPEDIEPEFAKVGEERIDGVIVVFDSMTFFYRGKLADIAIRNRMPTIFNFRQYVQSGGLISYGPNLRDMYAQSARHVQKLISGEAPGNLPMEQPTRFELVINLKTAQALGITVPRTLLARADEVIE